MGERFGKYELIEKIGEGGMAEVWRACATGAAGFQKILVVKKILPMYARNRAFVDMLVAEAKLCSLLVHPNIVSIHELGEIEGVYYIAMEHVDGVDLLQALQRAARDQVKVPTEVALFIAAEVARGLAYAHAAVDPEGRPLNLIHRDVSPANVMVGMRGEVKLMDFGVARADLEVESRRGTAQVVRHDGLKGKLSYMSPELVSGGEIDHRSDLFAVGTLLYEMLTLKRLFMGKSELQTMANVRRARITRRMEKHEYIPDAVQGILRRALAREPEERFQSAVELYEAIGDHLFEARLRVGPAQLAEFVATLFPERALKRASPKLASAPRRGRKADTVQDEGLPAALNAELETRRGSRAQDPDADTLEDEGRDDEDSPEDERDWSERDEEHGPPAPARRPPPERRRPARGPARGAAPAPDGADELLLALEREIAAQGPLAAPAPSDAALDDEDSAIAIAPAPEPPPAALPADTAGLFGPLTEPTLGSPRAWSDAARRADVWVRVPHAQLARLSPELFAEPGRPRFTGPLRPAWLPRLFFALASARATGLLQLSHGWVRKELHYRAGALVHLQSNLKSELLLAVAQDVGAVSPDQVTAALHTARALGLPVGEGLISIGALDETRLPAILREQQRRRLRELFAWREGTYAFYDVETLPAMVHAEALDVRALVPAAVREHFDLDLLRDILRPWASLPLRRAPAPSAEPLGLTPDELTALAALEDGQALGDLLAPGAPHADELVLLRAVFLALSFERLRSSP